MQLDRHTVLPFLILSLSLHLLLFFPWVHTPEKKNAPEVIPFAYIPMIDQLVIESTEAPSRSPQENVQIPKPSREIPQPSREIPQPSREIPQPSREIPRVMARARKPGPRTEKPKPKAPSPVRKTPIVKTPLREDRERETIVRRPFPTLADILPPVGTGLSYSKGDEGEGAIRLDSQDPKYVTYLTSIKHAIELAWQYPDPALRNGVQGKLVLRFTVLGSGDLMGSRLIHSSGFSILDEEALRAVRVASPFHPIPSWIAKQRLNIIASFEYLDNRLNYTFTQ